MKIDKLYESIVISPLYGGRKWITIKDIEYTFKSFGEDFTVYIKKGFEFDGASVPRILHLIGTPMGTDTLPGALFHDYLYRMQYTTREQADQCFNELMIITKTNPNKRKRFYIGVRIGGWVAWNKKKTNK